MLVPMAESNVLTTGTGIVEANCIRAQGRSGEEDDDAAVSPTTGDDVPSRPVVEDEDAARQRRLEARKLKASAGSAPKWNFGGKGPAGGVVDDNVR